MTIPVAPVDIRPQFVQPQIASPGLEMLMTALQHRQELDMAKQKLAQETQQFELHKRLVGAQTEGVELENAKKKKELKDAETDLAARDQALQLITGNLPRLGNAQGMGEVIAGIKDPLVAQHFYDYLTKQQALMNAGPTYDVKVVPNAQSPSGFSYVGINQKSPSQTVPTGQAAPNPQSPVQRIPVVTEREKASAAIGAAQANHVINALEATDPAIAGKVARVIATQKTVIGAIAKRLLGTPAEDIAVAQEATIEQALQAQDPTGKLLSFYQASKQWLGNVLPGLSGKQVTSREYMMQAPPYFSMGATNPAVTMNRYKARITRTRSFIAEAGDAMSERLSELTDPELYGPGTTSRPPSPEMGTMTPVTPRYHPRFRKP